jgi:hypothetical protein
VTEQDSPSNDILDAISRCAAVMDDDESVKDELHLLRLSSDPLAHFATSLIDLERARRGVPEAREAVGELAESLLVFWRDGDGAELAATHPFLDALWTQAATLMSSFERQRFDQALAACWGARTDAGHLTLAIEDLLPEGGRRVEFARCLYHLELARLLVDTSRAEFARRAGLLAEAYRDAEVAAELIAGDPGLEHLWNDIVPYLDEFFEHLEEQAQRRAKSGGFEVAPGEARTSRDVHTRTTDPDFQLEVALEQEGARSGPTPRPVALAPLPDARPTLPNLPAAPADDAPGDDAPAPGGFRTLAGRRSPGPETPTQGVPQAEEAPPEEAPVVAGVEEPEPVPEPEPEPVPEPEPEPVPEPEPEPVLDADALGVEEVGASALEGSGEYDLIEEVLDDGSAPASRATGAPVPPPLPPTTSHEAKPSKATSEFWLHTFQSLELLPGELGRSARILASETRADRKRLNEFIDTLAPHLVVPEARAFACLLGLMLAGQTKEKSLFGQPNPRRAEALAAALPYLQTTPDAAARAAVWFELDGPETQAALARGLSLLVGYLAFCNRTGKDPLAGPTVEAFTG